MFRYEPIAIDDLSYTDLRAEAQRWPGAQAYVVYPDGYADRTEAVWFAYAGVIMLAMGGDADAVDAPDVETGIATLIERVR